MYITAFVVGILGGVHCLGMCGGVVGALTFSLEPRVQRSWPRMMLFQLAYNFGRIGGYAIMGALFGLLGAQLGSLVTFLPVQQALQVLAGVFMISLGLYLGGWWFGVVQIERLGAKLWSRIQPLANKLTPIKRLDQAWLYGTVWGWLPCGLVYSMLIMALSAGSALQGGLVMLAFGLGTIPNLLLMGVFAFYFTKLTRMVLVRQLAGLSVIGLGLWQIYLAWAVQV
ncbi:sulfite exporter TauE/SafE family protein [Thiomicrorhabdus aquaedulcis]|uniref:urease accessory protein UreH domain-containing protein n=1 Tax=Thiomicrorhabdus aquaedulcis TaxID=2211106 RepID=UPI000FDB91B8